MVVQVLNSPEIASLEAESAVDCVRDVAILNKCTSNLIVHHSCVLHRTHPPRYAVILATAAGRHTATLAISARRYSVIPATAVVAVAQVFWTYLRPCPATIRP
jgi:hypothetical protein